MKELDNLITELTDAIKERVLELKTINTDDYYYYLIKEKELEQMKEFLLLLKKTRGKFSQMARINETEVQTLIDKIKNYLKGNR